MYKVFLNNKEIIFNSERMNPINISQVEIMARDFPEKTLPEHIGSLLKSPEINVLWIVSTMPEITRARFLEGYHLIKAAGGLVRNENNELLVIYRRGYWDLPKGKLDAGESLETCALREVMEETGIKGTLLPIEPLITYHIYLENLRKTVKETHWYTMVANAGTHPVPQTAEQITEALWANSSHIETKVLPNTYPLIRDLIMDLQK